MTQDTAPQGRSDEQETRYESAAESEWQITWRQFRKNRIGVLGLVVVYLLFAVAVFAPLLANGLPYYLRGVVTVFFDSDVTAWRACQRQSCSSAWMGSVTELAEVVTGLARYSLPSSSSRRARSSSSLSDRLSLARSSRMCASSVVPVSATMPSCRANANTT